ncbi:hypothetical protein TNCV_4653661 [Trichonephila clavipes]|nr:hypothetical protein TNCV_4653661 [Trichonephila clavipes]
MRPPLLPRLYVWAQLAHGLRRSCLQYYRGTNRISNVFLAMNRTVTISSYLSKMLILFWLEQEDDIQQRYESLDEPSNSFTLNYDDSNVNLFIQSLYHDNNHQLPSSRL